MQQTTWLYAYVGAPACSVVVVDSGMGYVHRAGGILRVKYRSQSAQFLPDHPLLPVDSQLLSLIRWRGGQRHRPTIASLICRRATTTYLSECGNRNEGGRFVTFRISENRSG